MNPLQRKLAQFLTQKAHKGIQELSPHSSCVKLLKKSAAENILSEDIHKICAVATFGEITKIFSLAAQLKLTSEEKREAIKGTIKKIAENVVGRVECKTGKLKTPKSCRHLLLHL